MRNEEYTLEYELPLEIRMEVYKEALSFIENNETKHGLCGAHTGLCLILPCILWDLDSYEYNTPNGNVWRYKDTIIAFPEIKDFVENPPPFEMRRYGRIELLKNILSGYNPKDASVIDASDNRNLTGLYLQKRESPMAFSRWNESDFHYLE